ncbi:MAG: hypothetical protein JW754_06105 [Candidatus Aenigmarchaeota archaeon]|nr:hypothetical protein [Candidatus Aenigmarchaeota archaeon]
MMIWDNLFWVWFVASFAGIAVMMAAELSLFSGLFGVMLIGLGILKLSGEMSGGKISAKKVTVKTDLLERIRKK